MLAHVVRRSVLDLIRVRGKLMLLIIILLLFLQGCGSSVKGSLETLNPAIARVGTSSQGVKQHTLPTIAQGVGGLSFLTTSLNKPFYKPTPRPTSTPIPTPTPSTLPSSSSSGDFATALLGFIYGCFVWVIIPLIILSMLIFSLVIVARVTMPDSKVSVRAGLLAGLVLFVIYVVSQLQSIHVPNLSSYSPHFNLLSVLVLLIGFVVGFFFLWGIRIVAPTRLVGLLTLILSSASLSALFSYFFASNIRDITLFFALSTVFGILVHVMFFPKTLREIFVSDKVGY